MKKKNKFSILRMLNNLVYNLFLMFLGIMLFFGFMYFTDTNIKPADFFINSMALSVYKMKAISHLNDNITMSISEFCEEFNMESQVECVIYQVLPFYNYTMHNVTVRSPDEYAKHGGVCRDSTVLFHTIFSRLGWYSYYDFSVPNHVFLVINKYDDNKSARCVVDGLMYNCEVYN